MHVVFFRAYCHLKKDATLAEFRVFGDVQVAVDGLQYKCQVLPRPEEHLPVVMFLWPRRCAAATCFPVLLNDGSIYGSNRGKEQ